MEKEGCDSCKGTGKLRLLKEGAAIPPKAEDIAEVDCPTCKGSGGVTMIAGINAEPLVAKVEEFLDLFGIGKSRG